MPAHRVLFLLHCTPGIDATHGGGRLIAHLIRGMADRHAIAVVHLRDLREPPMDPNLRDRCDLVVEVPRVERPRNLAMRLAHRLRVLSGPLRGLPQWAAHLPGRQFAQRVREVVEWWAPDVVQLEFSVMGRYLTALPPCGVARVLSHHMPGLDAVAGRGGWSGLGGALDRWAWGRFEPQVMRAVDVIVTFTDEDRRAVLGQAGSTPVRTVSIGAALPPLRSDPAGTSGDMVLFIGNYGHPPNRDGAWRLAKDILPLIRRRRPQTQLCLVGAAPERLGALSGENIEVVGQVADVSPYLDAAAVVAAPLRHGGGIRIKVLETLAAGKALVASPRALHGIAVRDGEQVFVADSDLEFAERIEALLADEQLRVGLAARARRWAELNLGWTDTIDGYEAAYDLASRRHKCS